MVIALLVLILIAILAPFLITGGLAVIAGLFIFSIAGAALTPSEPIDWLVKEQVKCQKIYEALEKSGTKITPAHWQYDHCRKMNDETIPVEHRRKMADPTSPWPGRSE